MSTENDLQVALEALIAVLLAKKASAFEIAEAVVAMLGNWRCEEPKTDQPPYHNRLEGNVTEGQ